MPLASLNKPSAGDVNSERHRKRTPNSISSYKHFIIYKKLFLYVLYKSPKIPTITKLLKSFFTDFYQWPFLDHIGQLCCIYQIPIIHNSKKYIFLHKYINYWLYNKILNNYLSYNYFQLPKFSICWYKP